MCRCFTYGCVAGICCIIADRPVAQRILLWTCIQTGPNQFEAQHIAGVSRLMLQTALEKIKSVTWGKQKKQKNNNNNSTQKQTTNTKTNNTKTKEHYMTKRFQNRVS